VNQVPDPGVYRGVTAHVRTAPFEHRFAYDVFQLLFDVDRLEALKGLTWLGIERFAPFSFRAKDHGDRSGGPLRPWVEARFAEAGVDVEGGPIRLLCFPRVLGYVFNPLSLFLGYRPDGALAGVIYEVNNTFGETHAYVIPARGGAIERQEAAKIFHVSPFFGVEGRYAFTLRPPGETFSLVVDKAVAGTRNHVATLKLKREPLTDGALAGAFIALPLMTLKVITAIHWEALKLWIKGARYHHKPEPPGPASTGRPA
jgi:uncharacterized protein